MFEARYNILVMEDIVLLHRKSNENILPGYPTFGTCLRQITFIPANEANQMSFPDGELFVGESATAFLISILCGLHSPILGETEVLGQFKTFLEKQRLLSDSLLAQGFATRWMNFIFEKVKEIRTQHLRDQVNSQGPSSYGSFVRHLIKGKSKISIFGSGQLAVEILPWLKEMEEIVIHCRQPDVIQSLPAFQHTNISVTSYALKNPLNEVLLIVAPMSDECVLKELELRRQASNSHIDHVIDLRRRTSEDHFLPLGIKYTSLDEFFALAQKAEESSQQKRRELMKLSSELARKFYLRIEVRPLGWDDLCA